MINEVALRAAGLNQPLYRLSGIEVCKAFHEAQKYEAAKENPRRLAGGVLLIGFSSRWRF